MSKCSISSQEQIKTYFRSTSSQIEKHYMVLHIHKEGLDKMDLTELANELMARAAVCGERFSKFAKEEKIKVFF